MNENTFLAWEPAVKTTVLRINKPASGTVAVPGGALLKAGTPLDEDGAVANTDDAKYIVAEDFIFRYSNANWPNELLVIESGYVDLDKAEAAYGASYTAGAKGALKEAGIVLVDGALDSGNVGAASPSDIPVVPEIPVAENQEDSTATTIAGLKSDFNDLLAKLKTAGIMAADPEIIVDEPPEEIVTDPSYS